MPTLSPRRRAALIALILFFGLGALAIHASPLSAGALEARLQRAAEDALFAIRADSWAQVRLDGQVATLSGQAPSRADQQRALAALTRASWAGGVVAGGITRVVDDTRLANEGKLARLNADLNAGRLSLSGFAPDVGAVERLTDLAEQIFPDRANVSLRIAPGAAPEGWDEASRLMLTELARLDAGAGRLADGRMGIIGLAATGQTASSVRRTFEVGTPGFVVGALIRVDGGDYQNQIADAALCELLIDGAIGAGRVAFTPARAALEPSSTAVLRRAGRAFAACDSAPLIVAVRAEEAGESGELLALRRAEAIIAAMASGGVDPARFVAESAPADSPRPFQLRLNRAVQDDPAMPDETGAATEEISAEGAPTNSTDENTEG